MQSLETSISKACAIMSYIHGSVGLSYSPFVVLTDRTAGRILLSWTSGRLYAICQNGRSDVAIWSWQYSIADFNRSPVHLRFYETEVSCTCLENIIIREGHIEMDINIQVSCEISWCSWIYDVYYQLYPNILTETPCLSNSKQWVPVKSDCPVTNKRWHMYIDNQQL